MDKSYNEEYNSISQDIIVPLNKVVYDSFVNETATRSSDRTDVLHESIKNIIKNGIKPKNLRKSIYHIKTDTDREESKIEDGYGKTISCDLIVKNKVNNKSSVVIMVKAPISSINKNFQNAYNNLTGEAIRILSHKNNKNIMVYFLNFIPRKTFTFDKESNIKSIEKVRTMKTLDLSDFGILNSNVKFINIYYDLHEDFFNDKELKTKKCIKNKLKFLKENNESFVNNIDTSSLEDSIVFIQNKIEKNL